MEKMDKIKIGIVGIGNCCSALIQSLEYYKNVGSDNDKDLIPGLMHNSLGGYLVKHIKPVAAFDVDKRKVGTDLAKAIFSTPNCTKIFAGPRPFGVEVMKGQVLDGVADHMKEYFQVDTKQEPVDIASVLKKAKADILINYLPVGSEEAVKFYAQQALEANCAFINCMPVFIASNKEWAEKFQNANLPIIGDDIKSQIGATIVHRTLTQMILDRGGKIDSSYQLNVAGNTDFRNMLDQSRLKLKKLSKTESVSSQIPASHNAYTYAGPNGCIDHLDDNKICHLKIDFKLFGNIPAYIDLKLSVEDSPNSAGVVIDAIRTAKLALDRKIGGPLLPACSYYMKHPILQMRDEDARRMLEKFINDSGSK